MSELNFSSSAKKIDKQIAKMSFESAISRLEEITEILSSQKVDLGQMLSLFEEGKLLKNKCTKMLEEAKMKFEVVNEKD